MPHMKMNSKYIIETGLHIGTKPVRLLEENTRGQFQGSWVCSQKVKSVKEEKSIALHQTKNFPSSKGTVKSENPRYRLIENTCRTYLTKDWYLYKKLLQLTVTQITCQRVSTRNIYHASIHQILAFTEAKGLEKSSNCPYCNRADNLPRVQVSKTGNDNTEWHVRCSGWRSRGAIAPKERRPT